MANFDPATMNMQDIENIAENADNLIKIISNIKQKVKGEQVKSPSNEERNPSSGPNEERKMNSDIGIDNRNGKIGKPDRPTRGEDQIDEKEQESSSGDEHRDEET